MLSLLQMPLEMQLLSLNLFLQVLANEVEDQ